jgi:hypothetical protein
MNNGGFLPTGQLTPLLDAGQQSSVIANDPLPCQSESA